jgi:hypothetical protein
MNLRPMEMSDADFMLTLKNYPETRAFAIASHDEIKKEDHYKWLQDNLQYFQVIQDQTRLGVIRIQDDEISVWVDRMYWRKGIASYILSKVAREGMIARIVDGNVASMLAFINAGFKPFHHEHNYYIMKKEKNKKYDE